MELKDFDLEIKKPLEKLIALADKSFPCERWTIQVWFWMDGDYLIELTHNSRVSHSFTYQKSKDRYFYNRKELRPDMFPITKREELR